MRHFLKLAVLLSVSMFTSACATTMTVSSHLERGLNFSQYRTYDWGPADAFPTGDPRLDQNAFFKDHVEGAVERQLAKRGLELVATGPADLLVHYHANISKRIDANRVDRTYGYCNAGDCPADVEYEAGTLVVDIIDARTNRLIWRGWAQNSVEGTLRDPDTMAETIEAAVSRMLQQLPTAL
jgi:hypothetical protein